MRSKPWNRSGVRIEISQPTHIKGLTAALRPVRSLTFLGRRVVPLAGSLHVATSSRSRRCRSRRAPASPPRRIWSALCEGIRMRSELDWSMVGWGFDQRAAVSPNQNTCRRASLNSEPFLAHPHGLPATLSACRRGHDPRAAAVPTDRLKHAFRYCVIVALWTRRGRGHSQGQTD